MLFRSSNAFTNNNALFGTGVYATNDMACLGNMACRDNIISSTGHIATARAGDAMGLVGDLDQDAGNGKTYAQMAEEALQQIQDSEDAINEAAPEIYDSALKLPYREPERIGDADPAGGWGKYAFYFKNSGEYQASGYTLYESRWQQRVRMFGGSSENWTENPVVYREEPTYPYPGKEIGRAHV